MTLDWLCSPRRRRTVAGIRSSDENGPVFPGPFLFVTRVGSVRAHQLVRFRDGPLQRCIDRVEQLFPAEWLAQEDAAPGYLVALHFIVGGDHDDGDRRVALDGAFAEFDAGGAAGEYDVGDENIDPGLLQVAAGTGNPLCARMLRKPSVRDSSRSSASSTSASSTMSTVFMSCAREASPGPPRRGA
ncbi:MAG TPA: hypothetical protein VN731_02040 [Rhodanobacter sp.]|nr:hypothetical protein [Rhodanobacter sp.]